MLVNNHMERGSENKYFPVYCLDQFIAPSPHPTTISKYFVFDNIEIYEQQFLCHFRMVLEIGIKSLVQFIGFEPITVFGFFVLSNLEKLLQYFV